MRTGASKPALVRLRWTDEDHWNVRYVGLAAGAEGPDSDGGGVADEERKKENEGRRKARPVVIDGMNAEEAKKTEG